MGGGRWWEFYFVRYAMGTLVGAAIVNQLMRIDDRLQNALMWGLEVGDGPAILTLHACYGLVFCYIASIPVLILHVARTLLSTKYPVASSKSGRFATIVENAFPLLVPFILWIVFVAIIYLPLALLKVSDLDSTIGHLTLWALCACLGLPSVLVTLAIIMRRRSYQFYKKLAHARASQGANGDLVASYRHLREHGNSVFIVILEFVLGLTLFAAHRVSVAVTDSSLIAAPQFYLYGLVLFIWTLPGALVWVFATLLENEFVRDQSWGR